MRTTNLLYALLIFFVISFSSCIDDLGNYDYISTSDLMPVTIEKFDNVSIIFGETLEITPVLNNMDDESRYTYLWYAFVKDPKKAADTAKRILGKEKNLSVKISLDANEYDLIFEVRDPQLDVFVRYIGSLRVTKTTITTGWYILKEVDGMTDIDYINNDGERTPNVLNDWAARQDTVDAPITIGNLRIPGKPIKMLDMDTYHVFTNADGTVTPQLLNTYHIITDKEMYRFNAEDWHYLTDFEHSFYEAPAKKAPQNILNIAASMSQFLINDGKLHEISGRSGGNHGKFPYPLATQQASDYKLHKDVLYGMYGASFFDTESSSFLVSGMMDPGALFNYSPQPGSPFPLPTNMEYNVVWMLDKPNGMYSNYETGIVLFARKSAPDQYMMGITGMAPMAAASMYGAYGFFSKFFEVPAGMELLNADVLAAHHTVSFVYFAIGNKLKSYNCLDPTYIDHSILEADIYSFPSDETISYISHKGNYGEVGYLIVLTNNKSANKWKLYRFPVDPTGSVGKTPNEEIFEGDGAAYYAYRR